MAIANPSRPTLEEFEAVLASHHSATMALAEWCALRGMAEPSRISAENTPISSRIAPISIRKRLEMKADDAFALRNVRLRCGNTTLSVAWNWYVSTRLSPQMNAILEETDEPFGKVVAPLRFTRHPISTTPGAAHGCPAGSISTHRALLRLPDGRPLAYVLECYTPANLAPITP